MVSKSGTFRNVVYNSLTKGTTLTCQLLASMVIARNLSPQDMGVVGFANIIIGFLNQFSDCGVGNAAIRRAQLEQRSLQTAFTLRVVLGLLAFGAALLISPFAGHFCDHPAVANVTRVLAMTFLISTIGFLPRICLTREMNYKALILPGVVNAVVRCTLAVILILNGWKFWAVVLADLGANLAGNIAIQFVRKTSLSFRWERDDAFEFLRFGLPLLGTGILVFAIFSMDNFLVSTTMGIAQLGFYALAFNWGSFVCDFLYNTVNDVLFPTFARLQNDLVKMRRWYLKTVDLVAFISLVANGALFTNAQAFLVIFLGKGTDKWIPALSTLQILCFYGIVRAMTEPLGNCLMVRNRTKTLLHANILCGVVQVLLLIPALYARKIEWVALAVTIAYVTQFALFIPFLRKELSIDLRDYAKQFWPMAPAMLLGWGCTRLLFTSDAGTLLSLGGRGLFTAAVIALTHGIFTRFRCFHEARELVFQKMNQRMPKATSPANL